MTRSPGSQAGSNVKRTPDTYTKQYRMDNCVTVTEGGWLGLLEESGHHELGILIHHFPALAMELIRVVIGWGPD